MFTGTHLEMACFINSRPLWISADVNQIHLSVPQPIRWPMAEAAPIIWFAYQTCAQAGWEQNVLPPIWMHFTSFSATRNHRTRKNVLLVCVCSSSYWGADRLWSLPLEAYSWIVKTKIFPVKEGNRNLTVTLAEVYVGRWMLAAEPVSRERRDFLESRHLSLPETRKMWSFLLKLLGNVFWH